MMDSAPVYIALPTYDGTGNTAGTIQALLGTQQRFRYRVNTASLIGFNFNWMWCEALNGRRTQDHRWFAMLHADVIPTGRWIDDMISEAERYNADVVSAVIPIKGPDGATSTSLADSDEPWDPILRLTQAQVNHESFPTTFDAAGCVKALAELPEPLRIETSATRLLVNTGCFVARLDRPWSEQVRFTVRDRIYRDAAGNFLNGTIPEDWGFSCDVARLGGRVMATKAVHVVHRGGTDFDSRHVWGRGTDLLVRSAPASMAG